MACTRNRNTKLNYAVEKQKSKNTENYMLQNTRPPEIFLAGNGLISNGRIAGSELAYNPVDIETFLFGIGSTNLEAPAPLILIPKPKMLRTADLFEKREIIMPDPLVVERNQRPFW